MQAHHQPLADLIDQPSIDIDFDHLPETAESAPVILRGPTELADLDIQTLINAPNDLQTLLETTLPEPTKSPLDAKDIGHQSIYPMDDTPDTDYSTQVADHQMIDPNQKPPLDDYI